LAAEIIEVPAALINRLEPEHIEVLAASSKAGNPYERGDRESLEMGPYCAALMFEQSMILIPDAREDPAWRHSSALEYGMISYLGFPLRWPDGDLFGTICVMDSRKNEFAGKYQRLLATLRNLVESDLRSLMQTAESAQAAHTKLLDSEAKFATAFHESPVPMVISTLEAGRLIEVNRAAFEQVIGYAAEEVVGRRALEIGLWFDPGDREHWVSELQNHGTVRDIELCFRNKSGEQVCCNTTTSVVMIGNERCLLTAAEDVTEQRRVEQELRDSEERYRSFVHNFAGIAYQGKDFIPIFFHGNVEGITGYKEEDFLAGQPKWNEVVHPDDIGVFATEDERKLHEPGGHAYEREYRIVRKDGRVVWINDHIQSVCDETGAPLHVQGTLQDITKRKCAEEALMQSAREFRAVFNQTPHFAMLLAADGTILKINRRALSFVKIEEEAVIGRPFWEAPWWPQSPDFINEIRGGLEKASAGETVQGEAPYPDTEGNIRFITGNITPITNTQGEIVNLLALAWDMTERKRTEDELRREKMRAQRYLDIAETFLLALDRNGRISLINRKGCDLVGYEEEELLGNNWFELCLPEEQSERVKTVFASLMSGDMEPAEQYENCVRTKEGERRLVLWHNTLMRDSQGRIIGTLSSGEDITERRRVEDALRASEQKFRAVFDQSIQYTGLLSLDGTMLEANKSALDLVGVEAGDVVGKPFWNTPWWSHSTEEQERLRAALKKATAGETVHYDAIHMDSKGRRREIDFYLGPFTDDNGEVIGAIPVGFDITSLKQAEREVRASREALRALAAELSTAEERERRRIASNLHDQLGQALAVLRMKFGSLTTAADEEESAQLIAEIRDLLEKAIEDTSTLTFDLSPPILYELGVEAAIEWAGEKLCGEHELSFEFSDDGRPKPLEDDARPLLYRCARELMMNVVKHSGASNLKVEVGRDGDMVSVAVEDDGAGFVPPAGGKDVQSGGFGLYSIQERIKHLGGTFHLESKPNGGTRAMVSAPIKGAPS